MVFATTGCSSWPKYVVTGTAATAGAIAAGTAGAVGGAVLGDVAGELIVDPIISAGKTKAVVEQKVDSVWSLLARLGEVAGWVVGAFLVLPLVIPLLLGYLIPSPGSRRKK